jgi:hypothetical protein
MGHRQGWHPAKPTDDDILQLHSKWRCVYFFNTGRVLWTGPIWAWALKAPLPSWEASFSVWKLFSHSLLHTTICTLLSQWSWKTQTGRVRLWRTLRWTNLPTVFFEIHCPFWKFLSPNTLQNCANHWCWHLYCPCDLKKHNCLQIDI